MKEENEKKRISAARRAEMNLEKKKEKVNSSKPELPPKPVS